MKPLAGLSCCLSSVTKLSPFLPDSSVAFVQRLNRPTESRAVAQPGRFGHPKRREMLLCIWEAARITPPRPPAKGRSDAEKQISERGSGPLTPAGYHYATLLL